MKNKFLVPVVALMLMMGFSSCYVSYRAHHRPHYYRPHHHYYR